MMFDEEDTLQDDGECFNDENDETIKTLQPRQSQSAPQSPACSPPRNKSQNCQSINKCAKLKRQVTFPEDGFVVTSYFEPPIPWIDCQGICPEDITECYKKSCTRHGVTPIQSVITQIQKVEDLHTRHDELDLSGERLVPAQCEALEEIFKHIQFVKLSMRSCYLDDEASMALFDMIEFYEAATHVDISHNHAIATRGWLACSHMLKKTPCLESLDASDTTLNVQCMPILCRALRLSCNNLSILHLRNCSITEKTFAILVAALKMNFSLNELYLQHNDIKDSDGYQLSNLLRSNTEIQVLDISFNNLQDVGISQGIEGLEDQPNIPNAGLKALNLSNNRFTLKSMSAMSKSLCKTNSLELLDLSHNNITDDGILQLKEGLMKNRSLKHIILEDCDITCEGAIALAEVIADNHSIESVNLKQNRIMFGGCMALSLSLKVNTSVTLIQLDLPQPIQNGESMCEYQQIFRDISNFCTRNKQISNENCHNNNNCSPTNNEEIKEQMVPEVVLNCSEQPNNTTSFTNGRFHVSKAQINMSQSPPPASKVNGRFTVSKVSSPAVDIPKPKTEQITNCNVDGQAKLNVQNEKIECSLPLSPNHNKRRVTIDGGVVPTVHKIVRDLKARRKSTPALGINLSGMSRGSVSIKPSLKLNLNKQLECLDLRSTVPLSPGRLVETCGLPMTAMDSFM